MNAPSVSIFVCGLNYLRGRIFMGETNNTNEVDKDVTNNQALEEENSKPPHNGYKIEIVSDDLEVNITREGITSSEKSKANNVVNMSTITLMIITAILAVGSIGLNLIQMNETNNKIVNVVILGLLTVLVAVCTYYGIRQIKIIDKLSKKK